MLHCNVDRLWAKWQWVYQRFDVTSEDTYPNLGSAADVGAARKGRNLKDTLWPWDGDVNPPRPNTAPGNGFPPSSIATAPRTASPTLEEMIDYDGKAAYTHRLGFDYDDIYELE